MSERSELVIYNNKLTTAHSHEVMRNQEFKKKILSVLAVCVSSRIRKLRKKPKNRRFWIHPLFQLRRSFGFYESIFPTLSVHEDKFKNYMRMTPTQFEKLLFIIGPIISKSDTNFRESIPAAARLAMTLRYLATGDCITSTTYNYLIGLTTASKIIAETCQAIWDGLNQQVLPFPLHNKDWKRIENEFRNQWNFNHCIGAIDGKHVLIECPPNAGSAFYNYKHSHSIVLLAICDANYKFIFVDIGAYGRRSDGGIFRDSKMGKAFKENKMNVPQPEHLTVDGLPLPYVLVGDEAFQLTNYLLRPYPGRGIDGGAGLSQEKSIFNYRLSRARRTIENAFGILVSRWRVLKKPIIASIDTTKCIVQAIVCLHNWLRTTGIDCEYVSPDLVDQESTAGFIPGLWREQIVDSGIRDMHYRGNNNATTTAASIRDEFRDFFNEEGAISWQYHRKL